MFAEDESFHQSFFKSALRSTFFCFISSLWLMPEKWRGKKRFHFSFNLFCLDNPVREFEPVGLKELLYRELDRKLTC